MNNKGWGDDMQSQQNFPGGHHNNKKHGKKKHWQNEGYQKYGDQFSNQDKQMGNWGMKNQHGFYHNNHNNHSNHYNKNMN
mmetsp:Transcript_23036/g.22409  ORF Transcript_23036/g.22409 Transcript_23036/m.22409 type:complete len:80 (-) Transcript_23036:3011-3250(-)